MALLIVLDGIHRVSRLSAPPTRRSDGTYEIQDGKVYKLPFTWLPIFGGFSYAVAADHPLYKQTPERTQLLYNLGIEFLNQYLPTLNGNGQPFSLCLFQKSRSLSSRRPIIKKDDPTLIEFNKLELQKPANSIRQTYGPPSLEEIRKNGIQIPEKMYLALGDNHAMSSDSRQFGFVPEDNLKGGVSFLFSPPGERLGRAPQPEQPHLTFPNITVCDGLYPHSPHRLALPPPQTPKAPKILTLCDRI